MTLIVGLSCADGLVVASDSQATFLIPGQPVRQTETKLWRVRDAPIVWGASGHVGLQQKIALALEAMDPGVLRQSIGRLRPKLVRAIVPILKQAAAEFVDLPPPERVPPSAADLLICGYTAGEGWILEIERGGADEQHEHRGMCAIGSGRALAYYAMESLRHHEVAHRKVFHGQVIAYRVLEAAIRAAAFGLGPPVQMRVITDSGAEQLSEVRLREIEHTVALWKHLEVETLAQTLEPK
jgi:proteasome beta subunit